MRVRLSDPALLPDLLGILRVRGDCVATRLSEHELEAGLLGSHADGGTLELTLMVRAWQAAHPEVEIDLD